MKPKTKLEIIGPYTPEHDGPYVWVTGHPIKCVVHSVVDGVAFITIERGSNPFICSVDYIRNAREVPVAREFWVNEYAFYDATLHEDEESAAESARVKSYIRTIHVREVLPGDGE